MKLRNTMIIKMLNLQYLVLVVYVVVSFVDAIPIVLRETSPSGEAIVAISSANPKLDEYIARNNEEVINNNRKVIHSISMVGPGKSAAATGRSFASAYASSGQPFLVPFLIPPNFNHLALNNWLRNIESYYDPSFAGNGEFVTAINDNGHVYGNINGVSFDNGVKSKV